MSHRPDSLTPYSLIRLLSLCLLGTALCAQAARAQTTPPPVLLSEESSTRAISLESVTHASEPFAPDSLVAWGADGRGGVEVCARTRGRQPGEAASAVTAGAEDGAGRRYELKVEYVGPVQGFDWMSAVILRLDDDMGDVGDVLVWLSYHGLASNRVRVAVGHFGGGPPDDAGAVPTPPRLIAGRVTQNGAGLGGVALLLSGSQAATLTTAPDGSYSFVVAPLGDYMLTPQLPFFHFDPPSQTFPGLNENKGGVDFDGVRQTRAIFGRILDDGGRAGFNYRVKLTGGEGAEPRSAITDDSGQFSFLAVPAGLGYTVAPVDDDILTFAPVSIDKLTDNMTLDIRGARRLFSIKGRVTDYEGGVAGVTVELEGGPTAVTDESGGYSFDNLAAGLPYVVAVSKQDYFFDHLSFETDSLACDTEADFNATPHYVLGGRVTGAGGVGVAGIYVTLAGAQNGATVTDADGNYSLVATVRGNFTVTPSKEQGFYSFDPPVRNFPGVNGSRAADFDATLSPASDPSFVLEFDGSPKTVDHSFFWPEGVDLGHFFWEFWAMPGNEAGGTYMLSDGYGAAHALLFGFGFFGASGPGRS